MKRGLVVVIAAIALVGVAVLASPASPATSVAAQIRKINSRLDGLYYLVTHPRVQSETRTERLSADGGATVGRVECEPGEVLSGGGIGFDQPSVTDSVVFSRPSLGGNGWEAEISRKTAGPGGTATVYAVCVRAR